MRDLISKNQTVDTFKDNVVIDKNLETLRGGRSLNVVGFAPTVINAGHVVILEAGEYKPQPVDGSKDTLAVGIVTGSVLTSKADVAIMTRGTVNEGALVYPINAATKTALGDSINYVLTP